MAIKTKHIHALELDKILEMLSQQTSCEDSRQLALSIEPATALSQVVRSMGYTADANRLTNRYGTPTVLGMKNCTTSLKRAQVGSQLTLRELLEISGVLRSIRNLISWKRQSEEESSSLDDLFSRLGFFKSVEDTLNSAILSEEELADGASGELASIRRKIRGAQQKVRSQLDSMIRSSTYAKYLQEQIVTIRDGRFVVPVKAEFRNEVKGLVHDTSSSGATYFVEPMGVVEANNQIRVLQTQEKQEIDRILFELSALVGSSADGILESYEAAVELDLLFAKSRLADNMHAVVPAITDDGRVRLQKARHPLIDKGSIVPIDIHLGMAFDTLVITGPNTGGKTVALKTLGLLSLMAMCGLMIPASDGSSISVFEQILADIGDEQSIEQSLSTFSSHMTNIVSILELADYQAMVLVDELGAGTDPVEGAALAVAILERLREKGAKVAATTHYPEIKMFALETPGVENASCEFDVTTLRPTYRLLIGVPGRSNAFAISERLGLDREIIERAKGYVSSENTRFEDVVTELEATRQSLEKERQQAQVLTQEAARTHQEVKRHKEELEILKEREMDKARQQARAIVEQVKFQADEMISDLEELKKQQNLDGLGDRASRAKAQYRTNLRKLYETADPITGKAADGYKLPRQLQRGDRVLIVDLNREGTVLSSPDDKDNVLVQAGILKTKLHVDRLRLVDNSDKKVTINNSRVSYKGVSRGAGREERREIDLRGKNLDEAILELDRYIDSSVLAGTGTVTIIHGKGTGVLRKGIQEHLRRHPSVRSFRLGVYGEGEAGVTVAELK